MIKTLVTTLIAVAILFTAGAIENNCVTKSFDKFYLILEQAEKKLTENTATVQDVKMVEDFWLKKKKTLHVWIPHNDIKEIDLWVSECVAYASQNNQKEALCKIRVLKTLAKQIPFNFVLKFENLF